MKSRSASGSTEVSSALVEERVRVDDLVNVFCGLLSSARNSGV
jgi:hypothetical protein